jgi:putative ABC transport system ATP-binding protein/lipoprotein-releasing system ATP-binding protein
MITLEDVSKIYTLSEEQTVIAIQEVNLEIAAGEFLIITGRSGSGKTTLLNLASGLTPPTLGRVLFEGADLWSLSDRQRSLLRNQKIGFVFQFSSLLPALTALENVTLPTIFSANGARADSHERAIQLMDTVGLRDKLRAYPRQLSAGQQQRVVIARALFNRPEVLLADEPTSDLDEKTEREIMDLFQEIHAETGVTIAMVTHTTQLVSYGTRAIRMAQGQVADAGDQAAAQGGQHSPAVAPGRPDRGID